VSEIGSSTSKPQRRGRARRRLGIRQAQRRENRERVHGRDRRDPRRPVERDECRRGQRAEHAGRVLHDAIRAECLDAPLFRDQLGERCTLRRPAERLQEAHRRQHAERGHRAEPEQEQRGHRRLTDGGRGDDRPPPDAIGEKNANCPAEWRKTLARSGHSAARCRRRGRAGSRAPLCEDKAITAMTIDRTSYNLG
jgi:hypothetical protein